MTAGDSMAGDSMAGASTAGDSMTRPSAEPAVSVDPAVDLDVDRAARAVLARLGEPGDPWLGRAVAGLGAASVLALIRTPRAEEDPGLERYRARLPAWDADPEADGVLGRRAGARVLVPGDGEWPPALDDLAERRPLALWVTGDADLRALARRSVAVVGARACTAYGEHVAADLAAGLGDRAWTVVSGGAYGIDAAAHRGSLAVDAATVAVLACGVDVAYPAAHDGLFRAVRAGGAIVSELPPGSRPTRRRFLDRNRIIAALSRGTVVVEAAVRSGALNTAGHAEGLSRPVMAVPGPVTSAASAGCHELLRTKAASVVTDAADVLDLVGDLGVDAREQRRGPDRPHDGLDPEALRVLEALPLSRRAPPDRVSQVAGLEAPVTMRALGRLSALGLADSVDGRWRRTPAAGG